MRCTSPAELSRQRKGWGCTALEFQQRANTPSACTRNDSSLPRTRLNHWKYQNNDEVTFPEQGTGARYSRAEKHAKKGLGVLAGGFGRQAPWAFVSFKNSLRLPGDLFFSLCREQGTGQRNRGFKLFIHLSERDTNITAPECVDLGSRNKAEVKLCLGSERSVAKISLQYQAQASAVQNPHSAN